MSTVIGDTHAGPLSSTDPGSVATRLSPTCARCTCCTWSCSGRSAFSHGAAPPTSRCSPRAFEETILEAVENERIVYRITQGSPLRGHRGVMDFSSTAMGSRLHYVIEFGSVVPGLDRVIKLGLDRNVRKGLATVEAKA